MAWPRKQPDEPAPDSEQNSGVSGTRHTVADPSHSGGRSISDHGSRSFRAMLGPIRYAHGGSSAGNPAGAQHVPATTGPAERIPGEVVSSQYDYDDTAGLVYEAPPRVAQDTPQNEGIGIFGGLGSDAQQEPPTLSYESLPDEASGAEPPTAELPGVGPHDSYPGDAAWNEPIAATQPVEAARERQPRALGFPRGSIRIGGGAPADDQPQLRVRDLPPDVQMRFYRLRVTIMVAFGVVFAVLTRNWEISLTVAILAGIVDTIYRSRTAGNYANGASWGGARKRTRKQLARMRRAGYYALDARPIPNSREFIDHLVVGPTGVYAIDSEKWDAKLPIRTWNGKKLYHGPESQKDRLEHAVWEAQQASEILSATLGFEVKVRPALAIYGPKIPWDVATIRNVDVFTGSALGKYLRRRGRMKDGVTPLTQEQVRTIYDTATRMLPDVSASTRAYTQVG